MYPLDVVVPHGEIIPCQCGGIRYILERHIMRRVRDLGVDFDEVTYSPVDLDSITIEDYKVDAQLKDRWIISLDSSDSGDGIIDFTELAAKLKTNEHRNNLFRWIAAYHNANCALLLRVRGTTGEVQVREEYYAPQLCNSVKKEDGQ
jgi:hypothetical protein